MAKPRVLAVVGTRPDAIKTAPVVRELRRYEDEVETVLVATGQHREMLAQALEAFELASDHDLAIMQEGQTLAQITCRALDGLDRLYEALRPQVVIAQGDTTTTYCASLAAFYRRVPFAHVEAGLRTERIDDPFPEELNRRATALTATLHFAPTARAARNLREEGVESNRIMVTGNTGIDAVLFAAEKPAPAWFPDHAGRVVLLTTHRRENWGERQRSIALAAVDLAERFPDILIALPIHPNPRVRETLLEVFAGHPRIRVFEPPDLVRFVALLKRCTLVLTDSGGIQEEAPAFGVPVLVLRENTERPEGIEAGTARLVGTERERIVAAASALLSDPAEHARMARAVSPYGDGLAARRIRYRLLASLGIPSPPEDEWGC